MFKIRQGVFETNSSSTHSLILCSKEEYEKLEQEELFIDVWDNSLITLEEAKNRYVADAEKYNLDCPDIYKTSEEEAIDLLNEYDVARTLDNYCSNYFERFEKEYTTPNGESIVAFGYYGFDG